LKRIFGIAMTLVIVAVLLIGCGGKGSNTTATTSTTASSGNGLTDLLGKAADITNFYCEVTITSPEGTQTMKQWTRMGNPTKFKMEITAEGMTTDIIFDGQYYYTYIPSENMGYKMSAAAAASYSSNSSDASSITQYQPTYKGSETVNGMACSKYEYTVQGMTTDMWISKQYGLPVRVVSGTTTMDYTNFNFNGITDSMFMMPSGVTMITMPGM
jgi:outer membrane lipoprotein-sorting protein